jgi:superinfection exclusion protein B
MPLGQMPDLKKASDVAASLIARLDTNAPLLIALAIASIVGVFASLGLRTEWQFVFRVLAVFFVTYIIVLKWFLHRPNREMKRHLKNLGVEEKSLLKPFLLQNKRTASVSIFDPPSASLIAKGILGFTTGSFPAFNVPIVIQPPAWKYLQKHPEKVDLEKTDIGTATYESDDLPWVNVD